MSQNKGRELSNSLGGIVGEEYVMYDAAALDNYSRDMTVEAAQLPDVVVMPGSVEEVQEILKFANRSKTPVVPFVTGTNLGGLTIPQRGGIIVDLKRMNRIIEVDEENMYAVIEPGVSFGDMQNYLTKNCPALRMSFPGAPAITSVVANYLLSGLGNLAMKAGCHGDMINGMEVVLPTGETIKTGSICASDHWFGHHPLPDFSGLFIGWRGTSGIVTKASVQLWPKPLYQDFYAIGIWNIDHFSYILSRIVKSEITDEQSGRTREVMECAKGIYELGVPKFEWEMLNMQSITGATKKVFDAKVEALYEICDTLTKEGYRTEILPDYSANDLARSTSQFPNRDFIINWFDYGKGGEKRPGGGVSWVGAYLPIPRYAPVAKQGKKIMEKYNYVPLITSRTMGLGRYAFCCFLVPYRRRNAEEVAEVRVMLRELAKAALEGGALIYKTPRWASKLIWEKTDSGYLQLLKRLKTLLDPNDVMHPGMFGI